MSEIDIRTIIREELRAFFGGSTEQPDGVSASMIRGQAADDLAAARARKAAKIAKKQEAKHAA